jgi:hypothetical protein
MEACAMIAQTVILRGPRAKATAKALIDAAPENAVLEVRPPNRTIPQNKLFHSMLSDVSRAKPGGRMHTPDTWKSLFLHACGHAVQFETGLDGRPFPVGLRSSRLSKEQMAEVITFMLQWGDENGVKWSNEPDE